MSTTTLPNIRVSSDLTVRVRLKDGGVAIDWSTLNNIKAHIYSDAQRALAGRCDVSVDAEDATLLVCNYAANKPQYVGVNRIVVSAKYMGETKTYDKPAFNFVRWTADQEGEEITIDDPDVDVEIEVEDVTSSILQEAIDAALQAAADAEHAAHLVPLEVLQDCEQATADAIIATAAANAAGIDEVQATVDAQVGTPSVDVDLENKVLSLDFHNMKGETGEAAGFGTASASLTEDGGDPGVTVSASGPDTAKQFAFTFKNLKGDKGDKGDQGNTGSSVDYPYELVNNCTTNDATKGLAASQGVALAGEVSQLEAEVTGLAITTFADGYIKTSDGSIQEATNRQHTDYIDVSEITSITFTNPVSTSSSPTWGMVWYDENKARVDSYAATANGSSNGYREVTRNVPSGTKYARFTRWTDPTIGDFWIKLKESYEARIAKIESDDKDTSKAVDGLYKDVRGYKLSDYVWTDKKSINPSTGGLQTNADTIGCAVYFPVPVGATYVRFLDTDTIDTNVVWYNLGFYGSDYSFISRSSYAASTKWELPSGTAFIRIVLALRDSEGQSIGGAQADYDLGAICMFFPGTTKEELVDLEDKVSETAAGVEGVINQSESTIVRLNQNELSLGKSLNLSLMRWLDGKGINSSGIQNNPKTIACPDLIDVRGFSRVILEDLNTQDGNVLYYAITQLNADKVGLVRKGYRTDGTFDLRGAAAYIYVSLGLHNGSSDIGGHQADYDLSNAQLTLANAGADDARYGYDGERINLCNSLKWELVAKSTHASALQGGAAYGDYYFQFHGQNNKGGNGQPVLFYGVEVFNLKTGNKIQEILLGFDILKHNNAVTFSDVYYDANDPLPLIYASQENANARYCTVYRITNTGDQDEPFALTMVQVIKLPPVAEANYYYPNCYVDGNKLIYGGFSNVDTTKYIYEVYPLPAISDGETLNIGTIQITDDGYGEPGTAQGYTLSDGSVVKANDNDSGTTIKAVYLDHAEVISTFTISKVNPYTGNNATTQGGVAKDGTLYVTFGSANNAVLKAVDVATGQVRSTINLVALGLNYEPETAFIYNYQLGVGFNSSGQIVVFDFD